MPFDIDKTSPGASSLISDYPANEQASRAAIEGIVHVEHDATDATGEGRHKFATGDVTNRDSTITTWVDGSFYFNTADTASSATRYYPQIRTSSTWFRTPNAFLDLEQAWTQTQYGTYVALATSGTIAPDLMDSNFFSIAATTGPITFNNPSAKPAAGSGASWVIEITQGVTPQTVTWNGSDYVAPFAAKPAASGANAIDVYYLTLRSDGAIVVTLAPDTRS